MAIMEDHSTFNQRIARIEQGRGRALAAAAARNNPLPHRRSEQREDMLRGRSRGVIYLFAGFCAGLVVMAMMAGGPTMATLAAL